MPNDDRLSVAPDQPVYLHSLIKEFYWPLSMEKSRINLPKDIIARKSECVDGQAELAIINVVRTKFEYAF